MMASYLFGLALPILAGYSVASYCSREETHGAATFFLRFSLGVGLGIGASSLTYFLWLFLIGTPGLLYQFCEMSIFAILACWFHWLARPSAAALDGGVHGVGSAPTIQEPRTNKFHAWLVLMFVAALMLAALSSVEKYQRCPIGDWDAWAIWNLRARSMFRLGENWPQAFSSAYVHTDYPLLTPCGNTRAWTYIGAEQAWTPWMLGILLTFATVGTLTASICRWKSRSQGLLAGLTLLGIVPFLNLGASQYADVPLAFYFLAAVVALTLCDTAKGSRGALLVLSGLLAGMAAWTKNEGLLFLVALSAAFGFVRWRRNGFPSTAKDLLVWIAGAAPFLTAIAMQKLFLSAPNDLIAGQNLHATIDRLLDPLRYWHIAQSFFLNTWNIARPFAIILPLCFLLLGIAKNKNRRTAETSMIGFTVALMLAGYFLVYLTTPRPLEWHLHTSANRLLMHLTPMCLFLAFAWLATPEDVWAEQAVVGHVPRT